MNTISDSITKASRQFDRSIERSTEALAKLGIKYMAMQRVTKDGFWSIVTSNPHWMEYSSANEFYRCDPTLVDPAHYEPGIAFMPSHQNDDFQTMRWHAETYFDLGNCLAIVEKIDGDAWCTFLTASVKNTNIISTYISKFNYIKQAIHHFRLNNLKLLHCAFDHSVDLKIINKEAYAAADNIVKIEPFAEAASNSRHIELLRQLSPREREIMQHFLQGKTAKETSKLVNLSFRTIECYFNNIKTKLGCRHKRDLIVLFNE